MDFKKYLKRLKEQKTSNLKVVALCVLTATTFWVLNALNKDSYYTVVDYPIEFFYDRQEYMAVEELPSKVRVEIHGNGWDLIRKYFRVNVPPFNIELVDPSRQEFILTRNIQRELSDKLLPSQLTSILTDSLKINIDNVVTRKIKVQVDTTSATLGKNIRLASPIKVDPEFVTLKGPTSVLQRLGGSFSVKLEDEKINKNYSKLLPIKVPKELSEFLTLQEDNILVEFEVVEFLEGNKRLRLKKVNFPDRVDIESDITSVIMTYLVDERNINDLKEAELEGILNYINRNRQDSSVNVQLNRRPPYLENISFEPNSLKLKYNSDQE
ncbi:YbbR-like domain-containing protein [Litoribacter populi]|uniref:YbbR-like domain-containing protein n=1 Tax=Litoribacter populi TaxID=2598460 RepID=UPI001F2B86A6|nr:YbbR-like domain-containing protein [Litoribacter populi]